MFNTVKAACPVEFPYSEVVLEIHDTLNKKVDGLRYFEYTIIKNSHEENSAALYKK